MPATRDIQFTLVLDWDPKRQKETYALGIRYAGKVTQLTGFFQTPEEAFATLSHSSLDNVKTKKHNADTW